jgi:bifunctional non-homologous end joining protein LigD
VKVAHQRVQSCVVGGWRHENEDAARVGALLLGLWAQGLPASRRRVLRYAGKAGSGLATASQADLLGVLGSVATKASPFDPPVPRPDSIGARWLEPVVVVDVRHLGHTEGGRLRQPVVLGVRPDLEADDVRQE